MYIRENHKSHTIFEAKSLSLILDVKLATTMSSQHSTTINCLRGQKVSFALDYKRLPRGRGCMGHFTVVLVMRPTRAKRCKKEVVIAELQKNDPFNPINIVS